MKELRSNQRAIHNFLISSYATSKEEGNYSKLLTYLKQQVWPIKHTHTYRLPMSTPFLCVQSDGIPSYDTQYALRLCMEHNLEEACVHIYAAMGLYEEAVDLALKVKGVAFLGLSQQSVCVCV